MTESELEFMEKHANLDVNGRALLAEIRRLRAEILRLQMIGRSYREACGHD